MKEPIIINSKDCAHFLNAEEIIYCRSDNYSIQLKLINKEKIILCKSLCSFAKLLKGEKFYKVSRSLLINCRFIEKVNKREKTVKLSTGEDLDPWVNGRGFVYHIRKKI